MKPRLLIIAMLLVGFLHGSLGFAARAATSSGFYRPFLLAPCEDISHAGESSNGNSGDHDLAKQLANPISSLISVPFQNNVDFGGGPHDDGFRYTLNFQPVVPVRLGENLEVIIRTIVPFIHQSDVIDDSSQTGLGDITQSFFFVPNPGSSRGLTFGFGPALLYPSASDDLLGTEKLGVGPTAILVQQHGPWTYGALANHIWSVAGEGNRANINQTFLQPFLSYNTKTKTTFTIDAESTYNWDSRDWTVPINASVSQLVRIGKLPVSLGMGARYFAEAPIGAPEWGLRFVVTLLFPENFSSEE